MKRVKVTEIYINKSLEMAEDLYGLADINRNNELKKLLRYHINQSKKYLEKIK